MTKSKPKKIKKKPTIVAPVKEVAIRGRPVVHVISEEDRDSIQVMAGYGLTVEQIAHVLGMSKATFERKVQEDPSIYEGLEKGRAVGYAQVAQTLFQMATVDKNVTAAIFFAKSRLGWAERMVVDNRGSVKHTVEHVVLQGVQNMTDEQRQARLIELQAKLKGDALPEHSETVEYDDESDPQ